jgi:hypothetical protein
MAYIQLATSNGQLSILPTFSNEPREDKTSAAEWLQKVINNKQGAGWTNLQTVTNFRKTLRGEVLKWYNALPLLGIDDLNWVSVKTQFEKNYRAAPTISLVVQKLPEIKQKENKSVNKYLSRCAEILFELKTKTDISNIHCPLKLSAANGAIYMGIEAAARTRITQEIKLKAQILTFNLISGFHLIACLRAEIRSELSKKQD